MAKFLIKFKRDKKPNRARPDVTVERPRISVGSRPIADVHLADRLVAQEACELVFDGRRVTIEVGTHLGGVFVNGVPVEGSGPVPSGASVQIGHSLLEIAVDEAAGVCTVIAGEGYLTTTVASIAKKAQADFALVEDGPQEQRWGKNRVLATWNWIAAFAGILACISFAAFRDTEVVNRGELSRAHSAAAGKDHPQDCAACHSAFSSDYTPTCAKCHEGYADATRHPYTRTGEMSCQHCHTEHRGADASILPPSDVTDGWPRTCLPCHAGSDLAAKAAEASKSPQSAERVKDRPSPPKDRWLQIDGFAHSDHRVAKAGRASLVGTSAPVSGDVPVPCAKCHEQVPGSGGAAGPDAEFAPVPYETCLACHADWRVDVHGRDQGGVHCYQCHTKETDPQSIRRDIRTTTVPASESRYLLTPRRHDYAKEDCATCHVREAVRGAPSAPKEQVFRHDHHVRTVSPAKGGELALAGSCVPCHEAVVQSSSLTGLGSSVPVADLSGCASCHTEGAPKPVVREGAPRVLVDMFHSIHTVEPGTSGALRQLSGRESLSQGCLSCHTPAAGEARMGLRSGVTDCSACHSGHESLGGGKCALCHVDRQAAANRNPKGILLYRRNEAGIFDPKKGVVKSTTSVAKFDHFSPGHAADATSGGDAGCLKCHDGPRTDQAERVLDVPWPGHADPACVQCHVQTRFHR